MNDTSQESGQISGQASSATPPGRDITEADVLALRRTYYENGTISQEEAEGLAALDLRPGRKHPSWRMFFVEALTDYLVHQAKPEGYITAENADWLVARISKGGVVATANGFETLVHVLEEASFAPESLVHFALHQIRMGIIDGHGALSAGRLEGTPRVTAEDVDLIRRVIYAFGGDRAVAVSRAEAEVLFQINDGTEEDQNDPAWSELFVKAIANHLMAASGYQPPPRDVALAHEAWVSSREGVGGFLSRMLSGGMSGVLDTYQQQDGEDLELARLERQKLEIVTSEEITEPEAKWLIEKLRQHPLHHNERALLAFLKAESPRIDPALEAMMSVG